MEHNNYSNTPKSKREIENAAGGRRRRAVASNMEENLQREMAQLQIEKPLSGRLDNLIDLDRLDYNSVEFDINSHSPKQVASYTLNFASTPFIVIPAMPGTYSAPTLPLKLPKCQNVVSPDYKHKFFEYPFEAILVALHQSIKDFSIQDYHLMTDRSSFRQLFEYALGSRRAFIINFERYGDCLLMRRVNYTEQAVTKDQATSFEQICSGENGSNSHYFIGEFSLGNRKVLMRYEIDCLASNNTVEEVNGGNNQKGYLLNYEGSAVRYCLGDSRRTAPVEFIELKTRYYNTSRAKISFLNKSTWIQSFFAGVKSIVVGIKEPVGPSIYITKLIYQNVDDLQEKEWVDSAEPAIKKIIALLDLVQTLMEEHKTTRSELEFDGHCLVYRSRPENQSFIPPAYPWKQ